MRTPPPIPLPVIANAVSAAHHIEQATFTFVRGGEAAWEFNVASPSGAYRLKIYADSSDLEARLAATFHLHETLGISGVVGPTPLPDSGFTFDVAGRRAAMFPYILAVPSTVTPMSDAQALDLGRMLAAIHAVDMGDLLLPVERFGTETADAAAQVLDALPAAENGTHFYRRALADMLMPLREPLQAEIERLREAATAAQRAYMPMVVCHGDPSPENILVGSGVHLIDWDEMKIAPREKDLLHFAADDPVRAGYAEVAGEIALDEHILRYYDALRNNRELADFGGRVMFQDLSSAQHDHDIAQLRNFLRDSGLGGDRI